VNSLIYTLGNIVLGVTLVGASIAYTCGVIYVVLQALKAVVKR
jgi:hypothetical protein